MDVVTGRKTVSSDAAAVVADVSVPTEVGGEVFGCGGGSCLGR